MLQIMIEGQMEKGSMAMERCVYHGRSALLVVVRSHQSATIIYIYIVYPYMP